MTKHRLLILGSLTEFVLLTRMARERGIYTIVCDANLNGPAKQYADSYYHINVEKTDEIVAICKKEAVDGIITSFSDRLFECMVNIADKAGLKCYIIPEQLDFYRNKTIMKNMLTKLGISTPKYVCVDKSFTDRELSGLCFPVVAKPLDKYGSRGIFILNSTAEIREHFEQICESSDIKKVLVEEYNTGYEFNMMSWVLNNEVHVISIADREKTAVQPNHIPLSTRNVYPSRFFDQVYQEAKGILEKIVAYTGQTQGALSMQFFWSPGNPVQVCEIAGRFFGYEHELVEYSGGLSIENLLLDYVYDTAALKKALTTHSPRLSSCSAALYFHGKETDIADQHLAIDLMHKEDIANAILFYKEGERIDPRYPRPYVARYYLKGESRVYVDSRTEEIYRSISIKSRDGEEVLYRNEIPEY